MDWTKVKKAAKKVSRALAAPGALEAKLAQAVRDNNLEKTAELIADGAKPNGIGYGSENALSLAVEGGSLDMVKLLLTKGGNPNATVRYSSTTPFLEAVQKGDVALVTAFLDGGAKIETRGSRNNTALTLAVAAKNKPVIDLLLDKGANVDARNDYGWTAMFYAARSGDAGTIEKLIAKNARIDYTDDEERSAIHIAKASDQHATAERLNDYADSKIPEWQATRDGQLAHVSSLRAQGYRLTEVFNFETKQCTVISHDFRDNRDTVSQRSFADLGAETVAAVTAKMTTLKPQVQAQ